jgi:hypothetical protein
MDSEKEDKSDDKNLNKYYFDPNKTYLVVNGKPKVISSKSKYMLDMLIIED